MNRFLSIHDFRRFLDPGLFRYVGLHGWGEPLLNPHIFEMVKYARSKGVIANLTTNGTLLAGVMDEIFSSGLDEIAVGVYDSDLFSNVLIDIENFLIEKDKRGLKHPKLYLDITLYRENCDKITEMIRLASEVGIKAVIIHRLFNLYESDSNQQCLSSEEEKHYFKEAKKIARLRRMDLYLPERHSLPCRVVKRSIFVTLDGKVTPCTYLFEEQIGNAFEHGLKAILNSKRYADFLRGMKQHPLCGRCTW